MKMKKMIGAFALTAALAMGTAPAFAASVGTDNDEFSENGSTEIKAKIDNVNPQVRATVPLLVTVVFGSNGHSDIIGPNPSAYKITNVGTGNIQVTEAEITDMNEYFSSEPIYNDGSDWVDENGDAVSTNAIMLTYKTDGNNTYLTTNHPLSAAKSTVVDKQYVSDALKFTAEQLAPNDELGITLGGHACFPSAISMDGKSDTLCKIKYTIAAAA